MKDDATIEVHTPWRSVEERQGPFQGVTMFFQTIEDATGRRLVRFTTADKKLADTIVRAVNSHAIMLAELEKQEWDGNRNGMRACPSCGAYKENGKHFDTCSLHAAIRAGKGQ